MQNVRRGPALAGIVSLMIASGMRRADAQTGPELAVGDASNDSGGPMFYAQDAGFYEKAGLNVKLTVLGNPAPLAAAVAAGDIPIVSLPITQIAVAREKGVPLVIIAPLSIYQSGSPTHAMIALKDSPIRKASDCNGKIIATRDLGNIAYFGAKTWIDKNGGDSKSVRWIEIPDPQDLAALQAGRIDAASVSEPALSAAVAGGARVVAQVQDAIAKRFLVAGVVTTESYAKAHPDIVRSYAETILTTNKWANANQDKTAKILEKYTNAPVQPGSVRAVYAERLSAADIQPVLDAMFAAGMLKMQVKGSDFLLTSAR